MPLLVPTTFLQFLALNVRAEERTPKRKELLALTSLRIDRSTGFGY